MKRIDANTKEIEEYEDTPQLIIGNSCLMKSFSIFLNGDSLKLLCKKMRREEDLRITITGEGHMFEVVDTHDKYLGKKK